jgi:hypothetical protein
MLRRAKLRFILDDGLPAQLLSCLPEGAHTLRSLGFAQRPSREDLVALCRQKHGILVTADAACTSLLIHDHKSSWGILLLSANKAVQLDVVRRIFAGTLAIRPSVERMAMVEYVGRNRLLVDMRYETSHRRIHGLSLDFLAKLEKRRQTQIHRAPPLLHFALQFQPYVLLLAGKHVINFPHDPLRPPNRSGNHGLRPRARLRIEEIVGGLRVACHEDSRHNCQHALAPFVHGVDTRL